MRRDPEIDAPSPLPSPCVQERELVLVRWKWLRITKLADVIDVSGAVGRLDRVCAGRVEREIVERRHAAGGTCMSVPPSTPPVVPVAMAIVTPYESVVTTLPN